MPFSFQIDEDFDLLFIEASGLLTPEMLRDCISEYQEHPGFHSGIDTVFEIVDEIRLEIDGREASPVALAQEIVLPKENALKEIGELAASLRGGQEHRMACAGGSAKSRTLFILGMGLVSTRSEIAGFEELSDALEWVGKEGALGRLGRE